MYSLVASVYFHLPLRPSQPETLHLNSGTTPEQKFGALSIIVSLSSMIMRHPEVNAKVDQFMLTNVVPLIQSEYGFLRAAVCTLGMIPRI